MPNMRIDNVVDTSDANNIIVSVTLNVFLNKGTNKSEPMPVMATDDPLNCP